MTIKQTLIATLTLMPLLGVAPAFAEQHHHKMAPEMAQKHEAMMKQYMTNAHLFATRALDIFATGDALLNKGKAAKNSDMMMQGAKLLMMGMHMQNRSAEGLHEHVHQMRNHMFHAMMHGDPKQGEQMKKDAAAAHEHMNKYRVQVKQNESLIMKHASDLVAMGADMVAKGKGAMDGKMTQMGAHMMQMGMMLQGHLIGEGHGQGEQKGHQMKKKIMMFSFHDGMNKEEEVVIERH